MPLVELVPFLTVLVIASLGLASVALALLVWRRRGLVARGGQAPSNRWYRFGLPLAVLGALAVLVSLCMRAFFPRRGEVFLRDAVVVRADSSRGTPVVAIGAEHEEGDEFVSFVRRGQQAEIAALRLKRERIENDTKRLAEAPFQTDAAVVRRELELATDRRALAQRRSMLEIEHRRLAQVIQSDLLDRRVRRHDVKAQLGEYDGKLQRMSALLNYDTILVEQSRELHESEFISKASLARRQRDTQVSAAERQRLQIERKEKQALLEALDRGIVNLETRLLEHESHVAASSKKLAEELAVLEQAQQAWAIQSAGERLRCVRDRESEQRELTIRLQECDADLEGIARRSSVVAPFRGEVLYRHEAPAAAQSGEPIALFGPAGAVRARFRLTEHEAASLKEAGDVPMLVTAEGLLTPHITGSLVDAAPLRNEPGMVLAELLCAVTPTQARDLADVGALNCRLLWAPGLLSDWIFLLGFAAFVGGLVMFLRPNARRVANGAPRVAVPLVPPPPVNTAASEAEQTTSPMSSAESGPANGRACRRQEDRRVAVERRSATCRRRESVRVTDDRRRGRCRRVSERRVGRERRLSSGR